MTNDEIQHELARLRAAIAIVALYSDMSQLNENRLVELLTPPDMRDAACAATPATAKV